MKIFNYFDKEKIFFSMTRLFKTMFQNSKKISQLIQGEDGVTTKVEFGAVTPRVSWFGSTGVVSGAPKAGSNTA